MNITIFPADIFVVINKTILTDYDKKILLNLYQPIIGSLASNLYLSLWSYLDKTEIFSLEWTHHNLMTSTQLNLDDIMKSREKLEGIGLIKTYYKKGSINSYIYELYSPLNPYEFFNNPILSTTLLSNIGTSEFQKLVDYYKLPNFNLTEYENITCSFADVYDAVNNPNLVNYENVKGINRNNLNIIDNINFDDMLSLIPDEMFNKKSITKEVKQIILKEAYIYNFASEEMQDIIMNSINVERKIDINLLKKNCEKYYRFEHLGTLPTLIYKKQPEYLRKNITDTSKKSKLIYQLENLSPYEFLKIKNGGAKPALSDLKLVAYLLEELNMLPGVVNVLLDYVLKINDNKLTKAFVETIASQWARSNIKTVSDAMNIAEKEYKKRKKVVVAKEKKEKIVKKPNWFDKDISAHEASLEEQEAMEELLSEFK